MMRSRYKWLVVVAVVGVVALAITLQQRAHLPFVGTMNEGISTTTIPVEGGMVEIVGPSGQAYTINELPVADAPQAPDYMQPLTFNPTEEQAVRTTLNAQLEILQAQIEADPYAFNAWVRLGALRKLAGDYAGAAEVWEYVSAAWPTNPVSANNLADLYMNFLKDYPKAEQNYKAVVAAQPTYIDAYVSLYYLYRDFYRQHTSAAADIVAEGLAHNPDNQTLRTLQAELQTR